MCRSCLLLSHRHYNPLRDRIIRPASLSSLQPTCNYVSTKSMQEAVNAINEQGMSGSNASSLYGISQTTLHDHKLGKVLPGINPGAPTLSTSEENLIFLIKSVNMDAQGKRYWTLCHKCWHAEALTGVALTAGGINFSVATQFVSWNTSYSVCCQSKSF